MRFFVPCILALMVAGCGGGGGSDGGGDLAGSYLFETRVLRDECGLGLDAFRSVLYRVDQNGDSIVIRNLSNNATGTGSTVGNGWVASSTSNGNGCTLSTTIVYDGSAAGAISLNGTCANIPGECFTEYDAFVTRD